MFTLTPDAVTPALAEMLDPGRPTMPRAFNVLEGTISGQILTDNPASPTWLAVCEATYGTLYLGGRVDGALLAELVRHFRAAGPVGVSLWPDDPLLARLPPDPAYLGPTLYFPARSPEAALEPLVGRLPEGYRLAVRDAGLFAHSLDYDGTLASFGSVEAVLRHTRGVVMLHGDALVCEASTGAPARGLIEVGVDTTEGHQRRRLATAACAALIAACEAEGLRTWWDCAAHNVASARLARRLGYTGEREYRYVLWERAG